MGVDGDVGVEAGDVAAGGLGLGQAFEGVGFVEEDLALEVGGLDEVAVDEGEGAYAGAGEQRCGGGSGGPAADDGDMGRGEPLLAGGADAGEEDLARIAVAILDRGRAFCRQPGHFPAGLERVVRRIRLNASFFVV